MVEHDISAFLEHELANIRDEYNASVREDRKLPESWPGQSTIKLLVRKASPLFIFAATVCRFIADRNDANPDRQLQEVLLMGSDISQLDATYLPVLNKLIMGLSNKRRDRVLQEFRRIVGAIIVRADPLSTSALAQIIDIPRENIDDRLDMLHSLLSIPPSAQSAVRLLHLSFRDFLLDPDKRGKNLSWIDKIKAHKEMTIGCLRVMCHLRQDICGV
ncbi:hypothetical protein E5D57_012081 [Metarhizium anisopliae]|nr:hypothetical protein E5D57_012081 [Metarhizium anisopliae]